MPGSSWATLGATSGIRTDINGVEAEIERRFDLVDREFIALEVRQWHKFYWLSDDYAGLLALIAHCLHWIIPLPHSDAFSAAGVPAVKQATGVDNKNDCSRPPYQAPFRRCLLADQCSDLIFPTTGLRRTTIGLNPRSPLTRATVKNVR